MSGDSYDYAAAAVENEEDDGQRYADQVNAPLSRETLEALQAALASEECARYQRPRSKKRLNL